MDDDRGVSELETRSIEIIQSEKERKSGEIIEQNVRDLWRNIKMSNIHWIIVVEKERNNGAEKYLPKMTGKFSKIWQST